MISLRTARGWLASPAEKTATQLPRALIVSALAAALDVAVLLALVETGTMSPLPAAAVAYLCGGVLQYLLCAFWVFPNAPRSAVLGFSAFLVLSLVGLGITCIVIAVAHDGAGVAYPVAKVAALAAAFVWNFFSRKIWVFRPRPVASVVT